MPDVATRPAILFVCLGNICRSPLAEATFRGEAQRRGIDAHIDSAGTGGWHIGSPPDVRSQAVARFHDIDISEYRARQVRKSDFTSFTHIYALDRNNLRDLERLRPTDSTAILALLMDLVPGRSGQDVDDPYYGDMSDFERCWGDVLAAARALADSLTDAPPGSDPGILGTPSF